MSLSCVAGPSPFLGVFAGCGRGSHRHGCGHRRQRPVGPFGTLPFHHKRRSRDDRCLSRLPHGAPPDDAPRRLGLTPLELGAESGLDVFAREDLPSCMEATLGDSFMASMDPLKVLWGPHCPGQPCLCPLLRAERQASRLSSRRRLRCLPSLVLLTARCRLCRTPESTSPL